MIPSMMPIVGGKAFCKRNVRPPCTTRSELVDRLSVWRLDVVWIKSGAEVWRVYVVKCLEICLSMNAKYYRYRKEKQTAYMLHSILHFYYSAVKQVYEFF